MAAGQGTGSGLGAAVALGLATGLRSMLGAALLATDLGGARRRGLRPAPADARDRARELMGSPRVRRALLALAAGELIADKLPGIPDRTTPGPLVARAALGGVLGWAVARPGLGPAGVLVGGAAAVVSAFAGNRARRALTQRAGLPDGVVAVAEDGAGIALAALGARQRS